MSNRNSLGNRIFYIRISWKINFETKCFNHRDRRWGHCATFVGKNTKNYFNELKKYLWLTSLDQFSTRISNLVWVFGLENSRPIKKSCFWPENWILPTKLAQCPHLLSLCLEWSLFAGTALVLPISEAYVQRVRVPSEGTDCKDLQIESLWVWCV